MQRMKYPYNRVSLIYIADLNISRLHILSHLGGSSHHPKSMFWAAILTINFPYENCDSQTIA